MAKSSRARLLLTLQCALENAEALVAKCQQAIRDVKDVCQLILSESQSGLSILPERSMSGSHIYPDGSRIMQSAMFSGKWLAGGPDGAPLWDEDGNKSYFSTAQDAAQALQEAGFGPVSMQQEVGQ